MKRTALSLAGMFSLPLSTVVQADSLVGYWKMESTHGPVVRDSATAGSVADDGAWIGAPEYVPGPFGEALRLDGTNYLSVGHSADTNKAGEDTTIALWIQVEAWDTNWQCALAKGEGGNYRLARRADFSDTIAYAGGATDIFGNGVSDGQWRHLVAVTDHGTEARLYIDGVRVATGGPATITDTGQPLLIGANPESATLRRWKGGLDDLGLFNEAFDDARVAALYALATDAGYQYDLGAFNQLLNHHAAGAGGGDLLIGNHGWSYAAADLNDGRDFFALSGDGSGVASLESAIYSFTALPPYIAGGQSSVLDWETSGLSNLTIDDGTGPASVEALADLTVTPAATTTYTLSGAAPQGGFTAEVTVFVDTLPTVTLTATDTTIGAGTGTELRWSSGGADSLSIDQGIGDVLSQTDAAGNGSYQVNSIPDTRTYTITATNPIGSVTDSVTIVAGPLPVVNAFTIANASPVPGETVNVSWNVSGAEAVEIAPRIGAVDPVTGTAGDVPLATTTYTLTARNAFGEDSASVTATVPALLGVDAGLWTVRHSTSTGTIASLADADALLAGVGEEATVTVTGVAVINYGPGDAGEFPGDAPPPLGDALDDFAVHASATLVVNFGREFVFGINNDEGGRLRVNGIDVIVDDALHTPLSSDGSIFLEPGSHTIEYVYFEREGGQAGEVFFVGPDGANQLLGFAETVPGVPGTDVVINEFLASNNNTNVDLDGDASDWLELYNGTGAPIDLSGYYLTDDPAQPNQWAFPPHTLANGAYLVVWASGKNTILGAGQYHTNFRIGASGEYLGLYKDDGSGGFVVVSEFAPAFPPQREDVSYGRWGANQTVGYMTTPTPGGPNTAGVLGFVGDTKFDINRGLFTAPFDLTITADHPAATIRYTLDGSEPTMNHGQIFTAPIRIAETTVVRAAAFLEGFAPTNIDTQTYIFPNDVPQQDQAHAVSLGFPAGSVNGQVYRYGMTGGGVTDVRVVQALYSIPTISLVMTQEDFSSSQTGIFSNPGQRGRGWERPGSIELINEDGGGAGHLQMDCGVRIRGGFSRSGSNPKHAFRFFFRGEYEGDLRYPMFQDEGASRFENLDLRTSQNYSWAFQNDSQNSFLREIHGRDAQREMEQPYTRSRYYHLYINGVYWGLFMSQERSEASYGETYFGGDKDDYDVIKSAGNVANYTTEATDGTMNGAWRQLWLRVRRMRSIPTDNATYFGMQGLAADGISPHPDPATNPDLLEVENLIDYMLAIFYTGNFDAPLSTFIRASNNWYAMRDRNGPDGFRFFVHDGEHSLGTGPNSNNRVGPWGDQYTDRPPSDFTRSNPQYMHEDLAWNEEYRLKFGDRVHKHFFNEGAFTRNASFARLNNRFVEIRTAVNAELARWGGGHTYSTWTNARQDILNFISAGTDGAITGPGRDAYLINLFRSYNHQGAKPLYPLIDAPVYSVNGGAVPAGFALDMTNPNGTGVIYYTTDGTDPRLVGGAPNPDALVGGPAVILSASGPVKARVLAGGEWSALNEFDFIVGVGASADNLVISELHYNPATTSGDSFADKDEYEFIELLNLSATDTIELTAVRFDAGITFDFTGSNVTQLGPGARGVVVRNLAAFIERYPQVPLDLIAGEYTGFLNNAGERVTLRDAQGNPIKDFEYHDELPWPVSADRDGYSLVLNCASANPDHGRPENWRSHAILHGNPGGPDGTTWDQWAINNGVTGGFDVDQDGDTIDDFFEYAAGTDPLDPGSKAPLAVGVQSFLVGGVSSSYLTLTAQRNLAAGDLVLFPEISTDLVTWSSMETDLVMVDSVNQGNGTELLVWRSALPVEDPAKLTCFMRLRLAGK